MALFGSKKKTTAAADAKKPAKAGKKSAETSAETALVTKGNAPVTAASLKYSYGDIILAPHITEKGAVVATMSNAYVFRIHDRADKKLVAQAVKSAYGVTPVRVNIVRNPGKKVVIRGKQGMRNARSKAYVYLKKGDKIEFV